MSEIVDVLSAHTGFVGVEDHCPTGECRRCRVERHNTAQRVTPIRARGVLGELDIDKLLAVRKRTVERVRVDAGDEVDAGLASTREAVVIDTHAPKTEIARHI